MLKERIMLLICSILLSITVSFAWIMSKDPILTKTIDIDYDQKGNLTIADKNIEISIWMQSDNGYVEISNSSKKDDSNALFLVDNVVPHHNVPFKIRLKNKSHAVVTVNLSIAKFICDAHLIENEHEPKIYLSTMSGTSYKNYTTVKIPDDRYRPLTLSDVNVLGENEYSITLYEAIQVPPTQNEYVELDCYFYFDKSMDNSYQGLDFRVVTFRAVE